MTNLGAVLLGAVGVGMQIEAVSSKWTFASSLIKVLAGLGAMIQNRNEG